MIATASKHLALFLACLVAVACGGSEASRSKRTARSSDESGETDPPRKKKKKKAKPAPAVAEVEPDADSEVDEEERERQERRERMRKRNGDDAGDSGETAAAKPDANADEAATGKPSEEDEIEKRREKERKRARAAFGRDDDTEEATDETATGTDASEDAEDAADRKRRKAAQAKREAAEKKRAAAEARKEAAARKKEEARRKREEAAEAKRAAAEARKEETARKTAEEEEKKRAAAEAKKKKTAVASDDGDEGDEEADEGDEKPAKKTKATKKVAEADDDAESAPPADDEDEKPAKKTKTSKKTKVTKKSAKKKTAALDDAVDMTDAEPVKKQEPAPDEEPEEESKPIDFEKIEAEDDPLKEKRVAAIPVPGVDDDSSDSATDAPSKAALVPLGDRPLTLRKGGIEAHGGMRVNVVKRVTNATPPTTITQTSELILLGGSYGVSDKAEVGLDYAISVNPGSIKGPLTLRGAYSLTRGKLDVALAGALALDFYEESNAMTSVSLTYASLQLGGWVRYHATPKLALYSGLPALPPSSVGLVANGGLPPLQYQLQLGLNNKGPIAIAVPFGVAYQVSPSIFAALSLELASIAISNSTTALLFRDFIPFSLGAYYSRSKIDVGFMLGDDATQGSAALRFDAVLRYSIK